MPVLGILDGIVQTFELATQTWFSTLFPIAQNLFFALMVIQIAWAGIWSTLVRHESGEQVLVHLLRQVFVLSILYTVLISAVVAFIAYKIVDVTVGLRVPEDEEREGLDITSHGESAYHN